jgi:rfaE bifunctional protein nucleotidyltransferase chain/domain
MTHHSKIQEKIRSREALADFVRTEKARGNKIVFTNGCFDIMHKGHADYLAQAADKGDVLVVAVNTDASVKRQGKSASRPIQDEGARAYLIASLESVSAVVLFDEDTPYELIKLLVPDVLIKGSDYQPENIVGYDIVISNGGKVETIAFIAGYSTTAIEKKIKGS